MLENVNELEVSQQIDAFLQFLHRCEQQYHMAEAEEQEANNQTQDILHSLELEDHDYHSFARLSKELREIRQSRRRAKDMMTKTASVLDWIDKNRNFIKTLEQLLGVVRKAEKRTENRIYTPRARK